MSAAVISDNTSIKINGGGTISLTASNANVITTGANEYAKVKLIGNSNGSSPASTVLVALNINAVPVARLGGTGNTNVSYLQEFGGFSTNTSTYKMYDILVPPSSTLACVASLSNGGTFVITGSYVKYINTP
jgi:hypothetical protein